MLTSLKDQEDLYRQIGEGENGSNTISHSGSRMFWSVLNRKDTANDQIFKAGICNDQLISLWQGSLRKVIYFKYKRLQCRDHY